MTTRRHALYLGGGGLALASLFSHTGCTHSANTLHVWEGEALGAPGFIKLHGLNAQDADKAFIQAQQTIERLDNLFSLYKPGSEISILNREGHLDNASPELRELVTMAKGISILTDGVFDISVQVLWDVAKTLPSGSEDTEKTRKMWAAAHELVDYTKIHNAGPRIWFEERGMAITLNGIAQGYISEQVAKALYQWQGIGALVNIGEFQAVGKTPFIIDVQDPDNVLDIVGSVTLQSAGLATSSANGGYLGNDLSHIFNPADVRTGAQFTSASVVHRSATMADGLATAFTMMDEESIRITAKKSDVIEVVLVQVDGRVIRF